MAAVSGVPYANLINQSARRNGLDPWLLAALLWVESRFNPKARSSAGAVGIAQIELSAHPGVTRAEAENPRFAIPWAARYLAELKRRAGGSTTGALRAYNTGSTAPSPAGNRYANTVLKERKTLRQRVQGAIASVLSLAHLGRTDQGVDFSGKGAIPALADATVTDVGSTTGDVQHLLDHFVIYRLDSGPHRGQHVYVAENFKPLVKVGQKLKAGQAVGLAAGTYPYIEIGFNQTAKGWSPYGSSSGAAQPAGRRMLAYIKSLLRPTHTSSGTVHAIPVSLGGSILHGIEGVPGDVNSAARHVPGVAQAEGLFSAGKDAAGAALAFGKLAEKILTDPGYIFLWVGFALVGLAFVFLGVERLLGRSAGGDAGRLATVVAAPEAAPLQVGA